MLIPFNCTSFTLPCFLACRLALLFGFAYNPEWRHSGPSIQTRGLKRLCRSKDLQQTLAKQLTFLSLNFQTNHPTHPLFWALLRPFKAPHHQTTYATTGPAVGSLSARTIHELIIVLRHLPDRLGVERSSGSFSGSFWGEKTGV